MNIEPYVPGIKALLSSNTHLQKAPDNEGWITTQTGPGLEDISQALQALEEPKSLDQSGIRNILLLVDFCVSAQPDNKATFWDADAAGLAGKLRQTYSRAYEVGLYDPLDQLT